MRTIRQFETINDIDLFVEGSNNRTIDKIWENVQDSFEKSHWISAFNFNLKNLGDLTLTDGELV
jgi:hypothetical protein